MHHVMARWLANAGSRPIFVRKEEGETFHHTV